MESSSNDQGMKTTKSVKVIMGFVVVVVKVGVVAVISIAIITYYW